MNTFSVPFTLADRLAATLNGLARAVAARSARGPSWLGSPEALATWLITTVWTRVMRTQTKLLALLVKFQAGTLRVAAVPGCGRGGPAVKRGSGDRTAPPSAGARLPLRFAWLLPLVPCEAANLAAQLRLALADPDMVALLAASAQARRVLAPVCRMLGIETALLTPKAAAPAVVTVEPAFVQVPRSGDGRGGGRFGGPPATRTRPRRMMVWQVASGGRPEPPD